MYKRFYFFAVTAEVIQTFELVLSHMKVMHENQSNGSKKSTGSNFIEQTKALKPYEFSKPGWVCIYNW